MKNAAFLLRHLTFLHLFLCVHSINGQSVLLGHTYAGSFEGHSYYLSDCTTDWGQASYAAFQMGGYLAVITSQEEDDFVSQFVPLLDFDQSPYGEIFEGAWIGLINQGGTWGWHNGEPFDFQNWGFNELNNVQEPSECCHGYTGINVQTPSAPTNQWFTRDLNAGETHSKFRKYLLEFDNDPGCQNTNKSYICHNGNTICVNTSSVQAHLDHGDNEGPCGPCNGYGIQTVPEEVLVTAGLSLQPSKGVLQNTKEAFDFVEPIQITNEINVFPNPASEQIQIILPGVSQESILRILTLTGQEIHSLPLQGHQSILIDLSDYAKGIYLIDLRSANGHYQKKIVKL